VLPETFPGLSFNTEGICNYCQKLDSKKTKLAEERKKYEQKFLDLLNQLNQINQRPYDAIMAYSGGKDSSYTLKLLKEDFGLKVLAITLNHGFVSQQAIKNIQKVTETLNVDHIMVAPNQKVLCSVFTKSISLDLYPIKALERASSICNTCMNLTKSLLLKHAIEMGIPFISYGWSPGQAPIQSSVMKLNPSMIRQTQSVVINILKKVIGEELSSFVLQERHYKILDWESEKTKKGFLYNIHPLAFLEYNEEKIFEDIKSLGWELPKDTDANSTNCLLNAFANQIHQKQYGFHPYAFEIADLVRKGYIRREIGLAKLTPPPDERIVNYVKKKLGIEINDG
jgi:tRNA(Ile)-lysidine synthase TilS/MesJ